MTQIQPNKELIDEIRSDEYGLPLGLQIIATRLEEADKRIAELENKKNE